MTQYLESWLGLEAGQWITLHKAFLGQSDAEVVSEGGDPIGRCRVEFKSEDEDLIYLKRWEGQTRAELFPKGPYQIVAADVSWNE
jgi:hypothetical protein